MREEKPGVLKYDGNVPIQTQSHKQICLNDTTKYHTALPPFTHLGELLRLNTGRGHLAGGAHLLGLGHRLGALALVVVP